MVTLTYKNLRDEAMAILTPGFLSRMAIQKQDIDTAINDEINILTGFTGILEGEYTATGDDTNPYIEVDDSLAIIKRVHYGFTSGSDWGDLLEEISPLEETGDIGSGVPTGYWVQNMHRYNKQRIYFDKVPDNSTTIRVLILKWPDDYAEEDVLEFRRLWATVVKYNVACKFLAKDKKREFEYSEYKKSADRAYASANNFKNMQNTGMTTRFTDV